MLPLFTLRNFFPLYFVPKEFCFKDPAVLLWFSCKDSLSPYCFTSSCVGVVKEVIGV